MSCLPAVLKCLRRRLAAVSSLLAAALAAGLTVGVGVATAGHAVAQAPNPDPPLPHEVPAEFGQWLGPWYLEQIINPELPQGAPANDDRRDWGESAHAIVLPPREAGAKTLVMMVCRRKDGPECNGNGGDVSSKSFLLDPDDPMSLQTLVVN